ASAPRAWNARPPAARRSERGSQPGGSSRSAARNASFGRIHASGTANSCRSRNASPAPFPPMASGASAPRFRRSESSGTIQELIDADYKPSRPERAIVEEQELHGPGAAVERIVVRAGDEDHLVRDRGALPGAARSLDRGPVVVVGARQQAELQLRLLRE